MTKHQILEKIFNDLERKYSEVIDELTRTEIKNVFNAGWDASFKRTKQRTLEICRKAHDSPLSADVPAYKNMAAAIAGTIGSMEDDT